MRLEIGMTVTAKDVYGNDCQGRVECFGVHTVILSNGVHRHVLNKKSLAKQGYTFPTCKKRNQEFSLAQY